MLPSRYGTSVLNEPDAWRSASVDSGRRPRIIGISPSVPLRSSIETIVILLSKLWLRRPRIVGVGSDMIGRPGRRGHQRHPIRRAKAMPGSLWDDGHHPGADRDGLRRPVLDDDIQGRRPVKNVHKLVA